MKIIDLTKLDRIKAYNQFIEMENATYSCNVDMDVSKLVEFTKEHKQSFFVNTLYIITMALNSFDEFRMRLVDDKPVIFGKIDPSFTVLTDFEYYVNCKTPFYKNYKKFYKEARENIEIAKKDKQSSNLHSKNTEQENFGVFYMTCVPWIAFTQLTHPMSEHKDSQSIPRIAWCKYIEKDGKLIMNLNITVSHVFVDGYPLSKAFIRIQEMFNQPEKFLK